MTNGQQGEGASPSPTTALRAAVPGGGKGIEGMRGGPSRIGTFRAVREGLGRTARAPGLLALLWIVNLLVALPLAVTVGQAIQDSVGRSLVADRLAQGFDTQWQGELAHQAQGVVKTFAPEIVGAGAFFRNLESWWSGRLFEVEPALLWAGLGYALLWVLLLGGVLERFASPARSGGGEEGSDRGLAAFFGAGGRYFFRFLRLAALSGVLYYGVYRLARAGFHALEEATRDVTAERTVLLWVVLGAALVVALLTLVRVVFDYARIALVAQGRRSALGAVWAGLAFVLEHPVRTLGLYWALAVAGLVLLGVYALVAPEAGPASWLGVILAFLLGQAALATRLGLRLATLGGETALFASVPADAAGPPEE